MNSVLKILFVEDEPADVELVEIRLFQEQIDYTSIVVDNKSDFENQLQLFQPDIILSDYNMPTFNGLEALKISKILNPNIPFIVLTNSQSEEVAVSCLKAGASDYILKGNLSKLPFSIKEAMDQVKLKELVIKAESKLKQNEEKYRQLVEISPDGIFILQEDQIVFINATGNKLLKSKNDSDVINKSIFDFFTEKINIKTINNLRLLFSGKKSDKLVEARLLNFNNEVINVELSTASFIYNQRPSVLIIASDITKRKMTESHLMQSHKLETLGQISAGLAHQLNTPLAVMLMRLQMLEEDPLVSKNEYTLKQVKITKDNLNKISWLTKRMLGFVKKSDLAVSKVNINTLIISVETFLENILKKAKISIEMNLGSISLINIEPQMLEQVFLNTITNSIDSMQNGGVITITSEDRQINNIIYVSVSVSDKGVGMSKEDVERLFEPFFTTKSSGKGTGLGMFVSYNIVKDYGGHINVESEKGKGTKITINIPC